MSNIKKLRKLKIQWKILLSAMLVIFVFGGYMVFAKADSSVTVSVTTTATIVNQGTESNSIVATMSGRDENNVSQDSPDNYKPAVRNLKWTVSNSDIIKFVVSDSAGTKYADTAEGTANPTIYGNRAGKATITATYYTKAYGPDGSITYEEELGNDSVDIIVPLKINSFKPYRNGVELTKEEMLAYLAKVELTLDPETNEIVAPTFRQDIHYVADVAEEVARFFGYDKIPTTLPTGEATTGKLPFKLRIEAVARDIAEYCGFSEGMTYSFESPKVFDKLRLPADSKLRQGIVISNPLGEDYSVMRTTTLNGMLSSLATNYNRRNKDVRLYELGNVYRPKALPLTELPDERMHFTLGMYGNGDFFDMKGVCEEFFEKVGMRDKVDYDPNSGKTYLHPGRQANMVYDGKVVGYLGEVHPLVADTYGIGDKAYVAVIDILTVLEFASFNHKYTGIAKYPAVTRDLSMVVPKTVLAGQIEHILTQRGGKILESYQLFDIYEGNQIKGGYKSMAYSLVFRHHDKTLEESEITAAMKKILNGLTDLGIELRS